MWDLSRSTDLGLSSLRKVHTTSMARTRKRQEAAPLGLIIRDQPAGAQEYPDQPGSAMIEECSDEEKSPGKDHGLRIEKKFSNFDPLSGQHRFPNTDIKVLAINARPTVYLTPGPPIGVTNLPPPPSNNLLATQVMMRSNPSRADVDLGVTLAELREAPQLIYKAGRSLLQNGANAWLYYNFGWRPLVNDLLDLLDVPPKIDQRMIYLERAARQGGMRRRVQLPSQTGTTSYGSTTIESRGGLVLKCAHRATSKRKCWGTVKWKPRYNGNFPRSDAARLKAARRAAYGLTFDASTAWELIPWSWLIDYFGSMGDFLSANRNTVGLVPGAVCIMKTTEWKIQYMSRTDNYGITGGTGSKTQTLKERAVVPFVMPEAFQPMLNPGQLSNLAALGVNRIPKDILRQVRLPGGIHI